MVWDDFWSPFEEMGRMMDELRLFWEVPFEGRHGRSLIAGPRSDKELATRDMRTPLVDVWENEKEVIATFELPGVDKKDIDVNITDESVEVKVEKRTEQKEEKKGVQRIERSYTGFYRRVPLPSHVKADEVKATYNNGVLELRMPKKESGSKVKKIEIR
ncbi:Hsp20/alpha crystallin family protein [Candidatus Woesearchaeota archaeon CG08_land_8_20_14_0_20_47_9]|nr:MAG: Hsp20/alpha crystallin family protein [Candidatus Woesearchaeota archaeon CG08_land_8_20_14_0_20_47_9]HII29744.1 Hsp20/alpha crystallin family protein [Candidatus Woesearchaeota archaeon]